MPTHKKMKYNKCIRPLIFSTIFIVIASLLVYFSDAENVALFEPVGLFTYVGVLLGFAITIYTFTLSLVDSIKDGIHKIENKTEAEKDRMINSMMDGFGEMKDNIILLFVGLVVIAVFAMLKLVVNPFLPGISKFQIPEIALLSTFFFCTYSILDLMRSLFNLSETKLTLAKIKPKDDSGQPK